MKSQSAPEASPDTSARYLRGAALAPACPQGPKTQQWRCCSRSAPHPQCRPITSSTNVRWWLQGERREEEEEEEKGGWACAHGCRGRGAARAAHLCAVVVMASITSMMRCSAESVPMVMSVPQKSLSMEPTSPTMFSRPFAFATSSLICPAPPIPRNSGL